MSGPEEMMAPGPTPRLNRLSMIILAALALGIGGGAILGAMRSAAVPTLVAIAKPVGKMWLDGLTMTIVPLVFGLLVTGIASAAKTASAGGVAGRAMAWFAVLLVLASAAGAASTLSILAAFPLPPSSLGLRDAVDAGAGPVIAPAADMLTGLIAPNPIRAAADTAMVQVVIFALLFGFALTRIAAPGRAALIGLFEGLVETMLVLVRWVLLLAPAGVLALAFVVGTRIGGGAVGALLHYVLTIIAACLAAAVLGYAAAIVAGGMRPLAFARAAAPSQVVALSTQSSLACLPAMITAAPAIEVSEETAGVVLPLAVSLFRATSGSANIAVAIYVAALYGIHLGPLTVVVGVLVSAAVSLAAVGLPAQVSFFTAIGPVCLAIGAPIGVLPLLLAVETLPDIFRTFGNVTCDLAVTRIVGRKTP